MLPIPVPRASELSDFAESHAAGKWNTCVLDNSFGANGVDRGGWAGRGAGIGGWASIGGHDDSRGWTDRGGQDDSAGWAGRAG